MDKVHLLSNGCWQWTGKKTVDGYGRFMASSTPRHVVGAHRWSYSHFVGPIPEGLSLDHLCHSDDPTCEKGNNCPHRSCVNPAHLEPIPLKENIERGRHAKAGTFKHKNLPTHCKRDHELAGENLLTLSDGRRQCRTCRRDRNRGYNQTEQRKEYNRKLAQGDKRKASLAAYREANREKLREYHREYNRTNREWIREKEEARKTPEMRESERAYAREYYIRNREVIAAKGKAKRDEDREAHNARERERYHARKARA